MADDKLKHSEIRELERKCVEADLDAVMAGEPLAKRVRAIIRATLSWSTARQEAARASPLANSFYVSAKGATTKHAAKKGDKKKKARA